VLRRFAIVLAVCLALPPAASAQGGLGSSLQDLSGLLSQLADALSDTDQQIESANNVAEAQHQACTSSPLGILSPLLAAFAYEQNLPGMPTQGAQLNQHQCEQLSSAISNAIDSLENDFEALQARYRLEEQIIAQILQTISELNPFGDDLSVSTTSQRAQQSARASAARFVVITARGPSLRSIQIYFDRKRVARRNDSRAVARIPWRRAKPGLHRVRVVAVDASGRRLTRHLYLLRRDDDALRLLKR
jgi:hypothetical protein